MEYWEKMEIEEEPDPAEEHRQKKAKRRISKARQRAHERRLYTQITNYGHRRTIRPGYDYYRKIDTGRVKRDSHSRKQKWLKRQSWKVIRKTPQEKLPSRGNGFRKQFDYWWEFD